MLVKSIVLIILSSIQFILSQVQITSPQDLQKYFDVPIKSAYSNFGRIPYGYFTMGRLYYDPNDKEKDYACKPLTGIKLAPEPSLDRFPIIMVDRGSCSFVTKTRNVQNIGGHLALIVDNTDESIDNILMADDGTGSDIDIPAVLISKKDGDKIKEFFKKNQNDQSLIESIVVSVEFTMPQANNVEYQVFFSSANKRIYRLLKEFFPYNELLTQYTTFVPHYISHESPLYDEKQTVNLDHCLSGGKYCTPPRYDLGISNGKTILIEDIRQKCLYLNSYSKDSIGMKEYYWLYMINFYDLCIKGPNPRFNVDCSNEVIDKVGIDMHAVNTCINNSFDSPQYDELMFNNQNKLLEEDYEVKKKWKVKTFPSLIVNNKTINGAWTAQNVFLAICSGFIHKPSSCRNYFNPTSESSNSSDFSFGSIMFIILIVIAVNIVIIYVCKKYIIRRIHERVDNVDINGRINNVVSSYLALRDTK